MLPQNLTQTNLEIPATIFQQAEAQNLGSFIHMYKPWMPNLASVIAMVVGTNALYGIFLLLLRVMANTVITNWFLVSFVLIVAGVFALIESDVRVYLFYEGFIRTKGTRADCVHWEQINSTTHHFTNKSLTLGKESAGLTIRGKNGSSFKFNTFLKDFRQLSEHIRGGILRKRMPEVLASYNRGNLVPFGPVTINKQGLSYTGEILFWHEFRDIEVKPTKQGGMIIIKENGQYSPWAVLPASKVPQLLVFNELIHYARTGQTPYQAL